MEELERRKQRRKLFDLYPDTGPLRRELYPKHMAFFAAGLEHMERCMMAANRVGKCVTGSTVIETVEGERTAYELWQAGKQFRVWAWDGAAKTQAVAWAPFKKARRHQCFRVTMTDGRAFEGADLHRVLTSSGWRYLDELHQSFVACQPQSSSADDRSVRASGDRDWLGIPQGSMDRCFEGFRRCGARLRFAGGSDLAFVLPQADALQHTAAWSYSDDQVYRHTSIGRRASVRPSSRDATRPLWGLFSAFLNRIGSTSAGWSFGSSQGDAQPRPESISHLRSCGGPDRYKGDIQQEPFDLPDVDGSRISRIDAIGRHEVYDFHVPNYENYVTRGVVHHNTWGVGGYETALHLTGRYPEWWPGRRFDRPVQVWVAGDTRTTTRDIIQHALLGVGAEGKTEALGTGLIPGDDIIGEPTSMPGVPGAFDSVIVRHATGGRSICQFKSYDQGRKTFQGTKKDLIWLDEEPEISVYEEAMLRLTATDAGADNGLMLCTFTPLLGLSKVALKFLPELAPQ